MGKKRGTLGLLMDKILSDRGISVDQFRKRFEFKRSTVYRWMLQDTLVENVEFRLIKALAEVAQTTPADIYKRLGIDVNDFPSRDSQFSLENLRLYPLITNVDYSSVRLQKAIESGYRAKRHWYNGMMNDAWLAYESAATDAKNAKARLLATYLNLQRINIAEMTGRLGWAENLFNETQKDIQQLLYDAQKKKDTQLISLATRFDAQSQLYWLWAYRWFHGVSEASISEGEALRAFMEQQELYHLLPCLFIFLARCSFDLGEEEQALDYIKRGRVQTYALRHTQLAETPLFLDAGGSTKNGHIDYEWLDDLVSGAMADILIGLGRVEEALTEYLRIHSHRRPCAQWSFFHWPDPLWKEALGQQTIVTSEVDIKLDYSDEEWEYDLEEGGSVYLQALTLYSQGQSYVVKGDLLKAHLRFNAALELAKKYNANDLYVRGAVADSIVQAQRGLTPVAIKNLYMVEGDTHRITNPVILREFHKAQEAIRQI